MFEKYASKDCINVIAFENIKDNMAIVRNVYLFLSFMAVTKDEFEHTMKNCVCKITFYTYTL
jgi:hypothetical protein